ncbi:MAG: class I SAM-dependent methyltransferase [Gemmataceae bacterium]|nr:class I SAM-dependent methyltransferase [Gemmataceae bacterium]
MPRAGELTYYQSLGERGRRFALNKPFTGRERGLVMMEIGAMLTLLPPTPARVLECGCGTGWLTHFLQKCGYQATGVDVAPAAIELARTNAVLGTPGAAEFHVMDVEAMTFDNQFDAVVFYAALHHALDEEAALRSAYRALRPGGVCVTSEPGTGHGRKGAGAAAKWDTTEKDMPPKHIARLGKKVGFRRSVYYPQGRDLGRLVFTQDPLGGNALIRFLLSLRPTRYLASLWLMLGHKRNKGITVLYK